MCPVFTVAEEVPEELGERTEKKNSEFSRKFLKYLKMK